jgi:Flp pilus assembly protein TadB
MRKQSDRAVLITDAARSQQELFRDRHVRYLLLMSARAGCLVLGAVLVSVHPPLLWPWLVLCVVGMVLLPWVAVLVANDRPARSKAERAGAERAGAERAGAERAASRPAGERRRPANAEATPDARHLSA